MFEGIISNIFFFSPFICIALFVVTLSQDKKIEKLQRELKLLDAPELIRIEQEKHELEKKKINASINKTNLEIEKMIREGQLYIKVLKNDLSGCLKGSDADYVYLRFSNKQLEVLPNGTTKIVMRATWDKLQT